VATDKQTAANRLNAQKSTGPKTPEGRAAVRLNGVKHGLTAETIVLKGESESDFTGLLDSLEVEHDPATPTEEALVVQLAMATWRLRRLYHVEAGFYTFKMKDTIDSKKSRNLDDAGHMGLIADWSNKTLDMFNRQSAASTAPCTNCSVSAKSGSPIWLWFRKRPQWGGSQTCPVARPTTYRHHLLIPRQQTRSRPQRRRTLASAEADNMQ
jgi:hypothetical protein